MTTPLHVDVRGGARRPERGRGRGLGVVGVVGELLLTAGAFVLLFIGWQLYVNSPVIAHAQSVQAQELSRTWEKSAGTVPKAPAAAPASVEPPVFAGTPGNAQNFATLVVPRFGEGWSRPIAQGIGVEDVLNQHGVGHYPETAMPGAIGNFAVAGHRTGWGDTFIDINRLDVGDSIYVETEEGWYRYVFRSHEYVLPSAVEVLAEVPKAPDASATDRIITLTSCNPLHSVAERYIAYGVFDSWYPRAGGPPAEIAAMYGAA